MWWCCSGAKFYLTLCDPVDYSMPGSSVFHCLPEFAQIHVSWAGDVIESSHSLLPSSVPKGSQSFPASGSFSTSWLFPSGGQSISAAASASVLPVNIQGSFPLGLTGLISLLSKGLLWVFSSTAIWKHQFFSTQPSLGFNSYTEHDY